MKKILLYTFFFVLSLQIFAQTASQNVETEEEIELPDVTTVVNGKTFTIGKDSVPDYTKILPESNAPSVTFPSVEENPGQRENGNPSGRKDDKIKDIYAEGELGAGYPFYFKGDFSIYRASGDSPFEIDFNHESAEGFAGKKANEGYFSRNTSVRGEKSLFGSLGKHHGSAEYKMSDDGLQLKSDSYSDMVKHTISGEIASSWELGNGILIDYGADAAWFNRYGEVLSASDPEDNYEKITKIVDVNPFIGFGWHGNGFKAMLTSFYGFQGNLEKSGNLLEIENSSNKDASHRGQFKLALSWENDKLALGADGSLIIGTATGKKDILPAFTAKLDFKTEAFTEDRYFQLSARGGLDSYQEKIRNLENLYRYAICAAIPSETTDYFASVNLKVPLLSACELTGGFEFKKTAFENYLWQALYTEKLASSGLYVVAPSGRTEYNSNLGFSLDFSPVKAGLEWKAYWKDVPVIEDEHKIKASISYQDSQAKLDAGASAAFAFGDEADLCPDISLWAGIRLAPALSLALELNDVIKLFGNSSRDFAHSEFITTSGNAVLLAKFQF